MDEIDKQILKNQEVIMRSLFRNFNNNKLDNVNDDLRREWNETISLLNPPKQPTIAERTHDALSTKGKRR